MRGDDVALFGMPTTGNEKGIETLSFRKTSYKVRGNVLPRMRGSFIGLELSCRLFGKRLHALAFVTSGYVSFNVLGDIGPPIIT